MFSSFTLSAESLTGTSPFVTRSSSSKAGEMVSLSHPQSSLISPVFLNDAPMTTVLIPKNLQQLQISVTDCTPGSSAGMSQVLLSSFLFQSKILPTKGEIRKSLLSAHATACILWKTKVILHLILFLSKASPALMPSQVDASLIKILSVLTPACSYSAMILLARLMDSFLLKDNLASTSVETKPLIFSSNLMPKETQRWSKISSIKSNCCSQDSSDHFAGWAQTFFLDLE